MTGVDHPYWTSRKGNATRFALWHERRSHAAPYLEAIADSHGEPAASLLRKAAEAFAAETAVLGKLTDLLPVGVDEKAHWDESNIRQAEALLKTALDRHGGGMELLAAAVGFDLKAYETTDADALQKLVADRNVLVADLALARLVALGPDDLDRRLAALWESEADARKEMADGPIHRQLLFALARLDSEIATEAIGRAILFQGGSDDVPIAITRWAARIYWDRKGKAGVQAYLDALESDAPHVQDQGLTYLGRTGDASLLPRMQGIERPAAYHARILLGDDTAYPALIEVLRTRDWYAAYSLLRESGERSEDPALEYLGDDDQQFVTYVAALLSRIGTAKSIPALEKTVAKHPDNERIRQALGDLRERLK